MKKIPHEKSKNNKEEIEMQKFYFWKTMFEVVNSKICEICHSNEKN